MEIDKIGVLPELSTLRRVDVPDAFMFFTDNDEYTGVFAVSLVDLYAKLGKVPLRSVEFHAKRSDFAKWTGTTLGDEKLARDMTKAGLSRNGEDLRLTLRDLLRQRLKELGKSI